MTAHKLYKVTDIQVKPDYKLLVTFEDGTSGIEDLQHDLWGEVFEPLKDPAYFAQATIDNGVICWPNGADLAPDALYERIKKGHP